MDPISPLPQKTEDELAQNASEQELAAYEEEKLDVDQNRIVAAVSYIYPLSVVALLTRRDSRFVQFHARQGAALFCLALVVLVFPAWLRLLLELVVFLAVAYGFVRAGQGKWVRIPLVASLLEGRAGKGAGGRAANAGFLGATAIAKRALRRFHTEQSPVGQEEAASLDAPAPDIPPDPPATGR